MGMINRKPPRPRTVFKAIVAISAVVAHIWHYYGEMVAATIPIELQTQLQELTTRPGSSATFTEVACDVLRSGFWQLINHFAHYPQDIIIVLWLSYEIVELIAKGLRRLRKARRMRARRAPILSRQAENPAELHSRTIVSHREQPQIPTRPALRVVDPVVVDDVLPKGAVTTAANDPSEEDTPTGTA